MSVFFGGYQLRRDAFIRGNQQRNRTINSSRTQTASICTETEYNPRLNNVLLLCDEWKSSKGGLSTFNRELAVNLAKTSSENFKVHCYVSQSDEKDREDARQHGVNLVTAQRVPGSTDPLTCLQIPPPVPNIDIVIGHGRKFGLPAYFIAYQTNCKWVQFVHTFCEDLGKHKKSKRPGEDTIDENEIKHKHEINLCANADLVVGVGSLLQSKYSACLPDRKVQVLTPGIFDSFSSQPVCHFSELHSMNEDCFEMEQFSVFAFGRVTFEDVKVKGFDVIAKAIASLGNGFKLTVVGSPQGKQREIEKWFTKKTEITRDQLTIRRYCDQEELKRMLREAHLVALPSRAEGFGLVALEAISAGVPVLVSSQSGISKALHRKVENGDSVIVSSHDPAEWASRIKELAQQSPQQRSENAYRLRESYKDAYPWSTECENLKRMIEDLCQGEEAGSNKENVCRMRLPPEVTNTSHQRVTQEKGKGPLSAANAADDLQIKRRGLEVYDPALLQRQVWWNFGQLFGFPTQIKSRRLKWGDVFLEEDPTTGKERLALNAGCSSKSDTALKIAGQTSADTNLCPVMIYKEFQSHRPEEMNQPDSPFYLAVKRRRKPSDTVWYMKRPLAVKNIGKEINVGPKQQIIDNYLQ